MGEFKKHPFNDGNLVGYPKVATWGTPKDDHSFPFLKGCWLFPYNEPTFWWTIWQWGCDSHCRILAGLFYDPVLNQELTTSQFLLSSSFVVSDKKYASISMVLFWWLVLKKPTPAIKRIIKTKVFFPHCLPKVGGNGFLLGFGYRSRWESFIGLLPSNSVDFVTVLQT